MKGRDLFKDWDLFKVHWVLTCYFVFRHLGAGTKGYDCIVIPGAAVGTMCVDFMTVMNANVFCGNSGGLAKTKSAKTDGTKSGTICSKLFIIHFPKISTALFESLITI